MINILSLTCDLYLFTGIAKGNTAVKCKTNVKLKAMNEADLIGIPYSIFTGSMLS